MKILLINKFLYPKGGDAISTLTTGALLSKKGHDVVYWGMQHPLNPDYPYKELFVSHVDYDELPGMYGKLKISYNVLYSLEGKNKFEQLIQEIKPDIVHLNNFAHQISPSILHILKKYNIPSVITLRDYKLVCPVYSMLCKDTICEKCKGGEYYHCLLNKCTKNSYTKSLVNTIEMYLHHKILRIYDQIDIIIATSQFIKEKHIEMGLRNKIVCLPNFIDVEEWLPEYQTPEKTIVYFGRLSAEKGLLTLLEAVKDIDVQLKIIGDGPIKQQLEQKVSSERINNVVFMGYKPAEEIRNEISSSMAAVLPSEWYEAFGRTVIESFALGKPVIGARIGGIPELVIDDETGLTFEPGSAIDLRARIKYLISSPDKLAEMGKNGRRFVEENFGPERHYLELMGIYQEAIEKHK